MANTNADVASFLRFVADSIEAGDYGEVRSLVAMVEYKHDGVSDLHTIFTGRDCDNARAMGIMTIAQQRFMSQQD